MKQNWEENHWYEPEHHYSQIWPAICNLTTDKIFENDLNTLIDWTHPRSEIYSGMKAPQEINNDDGWGAARTISDLHGLLLQLRRDLTGTTKE